ncbi:hypothetical protein BDY17DRAFT_314189 [Neohortaea acidophila]|uniref:Uncharacterized protein n=1 Tax=Neohortaea acidophila TaxID=245834 RepID=A0A6A6PFL7_9PEZI|nr:uncharacterized protein BDY17DRAFT_314189 [Neohortaea acidophila]KAF2478511.1 hypothetical protein BDY17DRAFT_314189 [Neohortaea acidophila]
MEVQEVVELLELPQEVKLAKERSLFTYEARWRPVVGQAEREKGYKPATLSGDDPWPLGKAREWAIKLVRTLATAVFEDQHREQKLGRVRTDIEDDFAYDDLVDGLIKSQQTHTILASSTPIIHLQLFFEKDQAALAAAAAATTAAATASQPTAGGSPVVPTGSTQRQSATTRQDRITPAAILGTLASVPLMPLLSVYRSSS